MGYHALRKFSNHMVKFVNGTMSRLFILKKPIMLFPDAPKCHLLCYRFYPLFHLLKFIIQHKIHAFRVHTLVHRPFSTTDYEGYNTVSTVRETDSFPL